MLWGDRCVGDPWELRHRTIGPWETASGSWRERTGGGGATELTSESLAPAPLPTPELLLCPVEKGSALCRGQFLTPQQKGAPAPRSPVRLLFTVSSCPFLHALPLHLVHPSCLLQHLHSHPATLQFSLCWSAWETRHRRDLAFQAQGHSAGRPTLESAHAGRPGCESPHIVSEPSPFPSSVPLLSSSRNSIHYAPFSSIFISLLQEAFSPCPHPSPLAPIMCLQSHLSPPSQQLCHACFGIYILKIRK